MQQSIKYLFFTLILILLSSISIAISSLYLVDKGNHMIYMCDSHVNICQNIESEVGNIEATSVAISKDDQIVVFSSEDDHLYVCQRNIGNGHLKHCFKNAFANFIKPQGMSFDNRGHLFITNNDANGYIIACQNIESQRDYFCNAADHMKYTNSIIISSDNKHAYITQPNLGTFQICQINHLNDTFSKCETHHIPDIIAKPVGIAIDHSKQYLLIVDAAPPKPLITNTISCPLTQGGGSIAKCVWITDHSEDDEVSFPATSIVTTYKFSEYPVLIGTINEVFACEFNARDDKYFHCDKVTSKKFKNLSSMAYTL